MPTYEKLNGVVSVFSNSPTVPSGYGQQMAHLIPHLVRHGLDTAILSNYGNEAQVTEFKTPYGKATHYPKSFIPHSVDTIAMRHNQHRAGKEHMPHALITLYDVWVLNKLEFDGPILSWVPIDHVTIPGPVRQFLERPNVHAIAMAPHGKQLFDERGIASTYIPHAIDTSVFKPSSPSATKRIRTKLGVSDDTFLATMVAANKGNGYYHRKALAENIMAFAAFHKEHPNSKLYLHTDPRPHIGGIDLAALFESLGLTTDTVLVADGDELMVGLPQKTLADIYSASDVLLAASYGEGFGVPVIESQACGTPVITSNWAATKDLAGPSSSLVDGQLWWNQTQRAFFQIPFVGHIYRALNEHYENHTSNTTDSSSVQFASEFGIEKVWQNYWMPFLRERFG